MQTFSILALIHKPHKLKIANEISYVIIDGILIADANTR